jgi:hypothetical protein
VLYSTGDVHINLHPRFYTTQFPSFDAFKAHMLIVDDTEITWIDGEEEQG